MALGLFIISGAHTGVVCANDDSSQIILTADFRYRFEVIDNENAPEARQRHRIRARFGLQAELTNETSFFIQLASGSDDLVSSNQTLSGAFSSKGIVLDLAYGEYKTVALKRHVKFTAGKTPLPFFRPGETELLWDNDLRPEGITASFHLSVGQVDVKVLGGAYMLEERAEDDETYLRAGQLVISTEQISGVRLLKFGVGYFGFSGIAGRTPLFGDEFFGNSSYPDTTFLPGTSGAFFVTHRHTTEYHEIEGFIQADLSLFRKPLRIMADLVVNTDPDEDNVGWLFGFKLGEVKDRGSWSIGFNTRRLERDAVYAIFTDSNFGDGGSDSKGHWLKFSVGAMKDVKFSISYFDNIQGLANSNDYDRVMFDISSSFN